MAVIAKIPNVVWAHLSWHLTYKICQQWCQMR